jgi:hypothetical protein
MTTKRAVTPPTFHALRARSSRYAAEGIEPSVQMQMQMRIVLAVQPFAKVERCPNQPGPIAPFLILARFTEIIDIERALQDGTGRPCRRSGYIEHPSICPRALLGQHQGQ